MTGDKENISDILNSVKIPTYPPNKSQWKKLELAVKFINISKSSAAVRRASMKMEPKDFQQRKNKIEGLSKIRLIGF